MTKAKRASEVTWPLRQSPINESKHVTYRTVSVETRSSLLNVNQQLTVIFKSDTELSAILTLSQSTGNLKRHLEYTMIPTPRGKKLLMLNGYTYSQKNLTRNYYCSKKDAGCKARVKLDKDGSVNSASVTIHFHDPPQYVVLPHGDYVKV